jgi:hypothetical protein
MGLSVANSVAKLVFRTVVPGYVDARNLLLQVKGGVKAAIAVLPVFVIALVAWRPTRRWLFEHGQHPLAAALAGYVLALAPVCTLSVSTETTENLRYLYLPTVFVAFAVAALWQTSQKAGWRVALTAMLVFQGASLHTIGWNWARATEVTNAYRTALVELVAKHPETRRFYIACVPDNFRGAFAARNITSHVLAAVAAPAPREGIVIAGQYFYDANDARTHCTSLQTAAGDFEVSVRENDFALTNPDFYVHKNPAMAGGWSIFAPELQNFRARQLVVTPSAESEQTLFAVFGGGFTTTLITRGTPVTRP